MTWLTELLQRPPVTWWDVLDIMIVSIMVYEVLKLIRGTHAVQMAVGIALLVGLFYLSRGLQLETLNWLIRNIVGYVVFAAIVLMQADIRRALVHIGRAPFFRLFRRLDRTRSDDDTIEELVVAATTLAAKRTGAIIVIERSIGLRNYIESGIPARCATDLRSAGQHLPADLAAARRRGDRAGRSRRGRGLLSAVDDQSAPEPRAGIAPSRRDRRDRGERRRGHRRVGGDRVSSRSSWTATSSGASSPTELRQRLAALHPPHGATRPSAADRLFLAQLMAYFPFAISG